LQARHGAGPHAWGQRQEAAHRRRLLARTADRDGRDLGRHYPAREFAGQRQLMPARVESNVLRATVCARAAPKSSDDREFEGGIHLTTSTAEDTQYPSSLRA